MLKYFYFFITLAVLSLLVSPIPLNSVQKLISSLYILRLAIYPFIYLSAVSLLEMKFISKKTVTRGLIVSGIILAVIGWLQYFLYPDLRNLFYLGWDPHLKRIFSAFFDPNYFGLILVFALITTFFHLKSNRLYWPIQIFILITLLFTYSRSSYLALFAALLFYAIKIKKVILPIITILIVGFSLILLPRPKESEGVKLERIFSLKERLASWNKGLVLTAKYPFLGVGFNAIRYTQNEITRDDIPNHSGSGFDNSFIFAAATTGLSGLILYLLFLLQLYRKVAFPGKVIIISTVIHSLFLNSLFFPWVIIWLWMTAAV